MTPLSVTLFVVFWISFMYTPCDSMGPLMWTQSRGVETQFQGSSSLIQWARQIFSRDMKQHQQHHQSEVFIST